VGDGIHSMLFFILSFIKLKIATKLTLASNFAITMYYISVKREDIDECAECL